MLINHSWARVPRPLAKLLLTELIRVYPLSRQRLSATEGSYKTGADRETKRTVQ